jgi:AraC-like DNA-binding protein
VNGEAVTAVAMSLGYDNAGSFSRMFKRAMGASPSELLSLDEGERKRRIVQGTNE